MYVAFGEVAVRDRSSIFSEPRDLNESWWDEMERTISCRRDEQAERGRKQIKFYKNKLFSDKLKGEPVRANNRKERQWEEENSYIASSCGLEAGREKLEVLS